MNFGPTDPETKSFAEEATIILHTKEQYYLELGNAFIMLFGAQDQNHASGNSIMIMLVPIHLIQNFFVKDRIPQVARLLTYTTQNAVDMVPIWYPGWYNDKCDRYLLH